VILEELNKLSNEIIGYAIDVHKILGPGLLESAYKECLYHELNSNGYYVHREIPMPIIYKDIKLDHGYRMDLLVDKKLVIEIKTADAFLVVYYAQLLTYLRLGQFKIGLLINFNVDLLKNGIKRIIK
jgi:GxxExxY protein